MALVHGFPFLPSSRSIFTREPLYPFLIARKGSVNRGRQPGVRRLMKANKVNRGINSPRVHAKPGESAENSILKSERESETLVKR